MLLAVFSDSHGASERMRRAVAQSAPDHIVFLGDGYRDAKAVEREYPSIPLILLRGNCDFHAPGSGESILFELDGVRIFAAHGHRHGVKLDRDGFWNSVFCSGAALGLYGHTHCALIEQSEGRYLRNPGSIGEGPRPSYGLVHIDKGRFRCEIVPAG